MSRSLAEAIEEYTTLEDTGQVEKAAALRAKIVEAGYEDRLPQALQAPEEPSFMENWGRPIAEAGGALVGGAAGLPAGPLGVMSGAALGTHGAGMAYDYLGGDPAPSPQDQVLSAAYGAMGGPTPARNVGPAMLNGITPSPTLADDMAQNAAKEMDIPFLTAGQRGNQTAQRVEGALEGTIGGGAPINNQRTGLVDKMTRYIDEAWPSPHSRDQVGGALVGGAEEASAALRNTQSALYKDIDNVLARAGKDTSAKIDVPESRQLLATIRARMARDGDFASLVNTDPQVRSFIDTLERSLDRPQGINSRGLAGAVDNPISYDTLKQFRTNVGEQMDSFFATSTHGGSQKQKKQLYGVLSDDMTAGVTQLAGEPGAQAASRANRYTRAMSDRLETIHPIFKNADNPTKVFDALSRAAYHNPTALTAARKTLPEDAWGEFTRKFVRDLLEPSAGSTDPLSFNTIVTNLQRLQRQSPEGYAEIFAGKEDVIDNVLKLSRRLKESEQFINHSRTGNVNSLLAPLGALGTGSAGYALSGGDPVKAGAGAAAGAAVQYLVPKIMAHAMTSPKFAEVLSQLPTGILSLRNAGDLAKALIVAGADEEEVQDLLREDRPAPEQAGRLSDG